MRLLEERCAALDVKAIHLEVASHNDQAQKLYSASGFRSNDRQLLTKRI